MIVLAEDTDDVLENSPRALEQFARLAAAAGVLILFATAGLPLLGAAAQSAAKELRILPRLCVFLCALLTAFLLGGARYKPGTLLAATILFLSTTLAMHGQLAAADAFLPAHSALFFAAQMLACLFAGLALGARIQSGGALLQFLACAIAGDIWIHAFSVPDTAARESLLTLLRVPWPPRQGFLAPAPGSVEILVSGALAGCAPRLGLPLVSVTLGAFAGYCAASFLALPPWPAWPTLSVLLITSGMLIGCWPDMELTLAELRRAFLCAGLLMLVLAILSAARYKLLVPPAPEPEPFKYRSFT